MPGVRGVTLYTRIMGTGTNPVVGIDLSFGEQNMHVVGCIDNVTVPYVAGIVGYSKGNTYLDSFVLSRLPPNSSSSSGRICSGSGAVVLIIMGT